MLRHDHSDKQTTGKQQEPAASPSCDLCAVMP